MRRVEATPFHADPDVVDGSGRFPVRANALSKLLAMKATAGFCTAGAQMTAEVQFDHAAVASAVPAHHAPVVRASVHNREAAEPLPGES